MVKKWKKHLPWSPFPGEACVEDCVFSWPWQCHCDRRSNQYLEKGAEEKREKTSLGNDVT